MVSIKKLAAAVSLGLALNCGSQSGVPIKRDYPELTPEIMNLLEEKILAHVENNDKVVMNVSDYDSDEHVVAFSGVPQEYINYFIGFTHKDYQSKGILMPELEDVSISILPEEDVKGICGAGDACYNPDSMTIVMPDSLGIIEFFSIFSHEFGHHIQPGASEYPSLANATYYAIKAYEFSNPIGSLGVDYGFKYPSMYLDDSGALEMMYPRGALFAILNLAEQRGDIEAAMKDVVHAKDLEIETRLGKMISEYQVLAADEVYFTAWNKLLDDRAFLWEITDHLRYHKAEEFISYMMIGNYDTFLYMFPDSGVTTIAGYYKLLESFPAGYDNPYFKAHVVAPLTEFLHSDLISSKDSKGVSSSEVYDYAKSIIWDNWLYPCRTKDPYRCPSFMRDSRETHLNAYLYLVQGASAIYDHERRVEAQYYAKDFIGRFFPGADFESGNFDTVKTSYDVASAYLPPIAMNCGKFAMWDKDYGAAKKFFSAALAATCSPNQSVSQAYCESCKIEAAAFLDKLR